MITRMVLISIFITLVGCGSKSQKDDSSEGRVDSTEGDKDPKATNQDPLAPTAEQVSREQQASAKVTANLLAAGLTDKEAAAVLAAAKAKAAELGANSDPTAYYQAFGEGALAQLSEAFAASSMDIAAASKKTADLTSLITALAELDPALHGKTAAEKEAAVSKAWIGCVSGILQLGPLKKLAAGVQGANLTAYGLTDSASLADLMQKLQAERTALMEAQIREMTAEIQKKSAQVTILQGWCDEFVKYLAQWSADAKPGDTLKGFRGNIIHPPQYLYDRKMIEHNVWLKKGEAEGYFQLLKAEIDSLHNSLQMDTLRLQTLSNKRAESFTGMTTMLQTMQSNRTAALSNMRLYLVEDKVTKEELIRTGYAFDVRMFGAVAAGYISFTKDPAFAEDTAVKIVTMLQTLLGENLVNSNADEALGLVTKQFADTLIKSGDGLSKAEALITSFAKGLMRGALAVDSDISDALVLLSPMGRAAVAYFGGMPSGAQYSAAYARGETAALVAALQGVSDPGDLGTRYGSALGNIKALLLEQEIAGGEASFKAYANAALTVIETATGLHQTVAGILKERLKQLIQAPWNPKP